MHDPRMSWLKDYRQLWPGVALAVVLAAVASFVPLPAADSFVAFDEGAAAAGQPDYAAGGEAPPLGEAGATDLAAGGAGGALSAGGTSAGGGATAGSGAGSAAAGGAGGPASGAGTTAGSAGGGAAPATGGAAAGATYQGVTADSVLWGFSAQEKGCGGFSQAEVAAAYGANENPIRSYEVAKEYFNKFPLVDYPLPAAIRKHVNPKNGYWGRRIKSVFRDSGGFACPEVGRANAVKMAQDDRVFGLIQRGNEGPEVQMSLVMAQHKLIHIGRQNTATSWFKQRAPYSWDGMWGDGITQNIALGSWICRDWKGRKAHNTGDPLVSGQPRKFGVLYPDAAEFKESAAALQGEFDRCGVKAAHYAYPFDIATLEAQSQTVISRMKRDGVTTIMSVTDFITMLFHSKSATAQQYYPEWVRSGWGMGGFEVAYRTFMTPEQSRNAWAAADAASIASPSYYKTEAYRAWKRVRPNEEPDDDWPTYYEQFRLLALGMAGAGPNLTPETFGQGLARLCNPCARDNKLLPMRRAYPGHWADREGFTLVRFNPDKPSRTDKPDGNGNPPKGAFEFLEKGKRYGARITDPDRG